MNSEFFLVDVKGNNARAVRR